MDRFFQDNSGIVLGASVVVFMEVFPLHNDENASLLSAPFAKLQLQERARTACASLHDACSSSLPSGIGIQWIHNNNNDDNHKDKQEQELRSGYLFLQQNTSLNEQKQEQPPVVHLPSQNPLDVEPIPCRIVGYAIDNALQQRQHQSKTSPAMITDGTLVRIMPPTAASSSSSLSYIQHNLNELVGEAECSPLITSSKDLEDELVHNHNSETIRELSLRMSLQLSHQVYIGTSADAFDVKRQQHKRRQSVANRIQAYCAARANKEQQQRQQETFHAKDHPTSKAPLQYQRPSNSNNNNNLPSSFMMREGALLVHCPNHGTGKTALVQMIAQRRLHCTRVHVIQPGPLLAKYGSQADAALESILHAIVVSAAVQTQPQQQQNSICIILDHFDAMMPPQCSAKSSAGDAATPVLNAIAAYLKLLMLSLKRNREFLFPSKNPLYNVGGRAGQVLAVKVCLVAVVTCPDDGWRSAQSKGGSSDSIVGRSSTCILDVLPLGTYRLPASSAETRLRAFEFAFQKKQLVLTEEARKRLPLLAASAVWFRGKMFKSVAKRLRQDLTQQRGSGKKTVGNNQSQEVSTSGIVVGAKQIESALAAIGEGTSAHSDIRFLASEDGQKDKSTTSKDNNDAFFFVGGNSDAKRSLEDAIALDPTKRALLNSMGVGTPIGVLLYGPPGCGKTLLAKAVAKLLRAPGAAKSHIGGAFVSLNSSEIVQSAIGSSEKLIVSAFQTARDNAPSVIFIDEFQALFTERSSSGNGKLTSTLLQCMDDIKLWRDSNRKATQDRDLRQMPERESSYMDLSDNVLVLGATNTPWMIDNAFLRPGRFDRLVHVGLPSDTDRESILYVHISKIKVKHDKGIQDICKSIVQKTQGFSGADLAALCRAAAVRCLQETSEWIEERHFLEELSEGFVASSSASLVQRNESWRP